MNKYEFLFALRDRLSGLPEEDIERSLDYYGEMIDDRIEDGMSEEEAVFAVGSVEEVTSQILMETPLPKLVRAKVKPKRAPKAWEIVLLIIGSPVWLPLIFAAVIILLAVYIVMWSLLFALYAVDLAFAACAAAGIIASLPYMMHGNMTQSALLFGSGLICAGIAVLLFFGSAQFGKGVISAGEKFLLSIKHCFIRREDAR